MRRAWVAAFLAPVLAATAQAHVLPDPTVLVIVPMPGAIEIRVNDMSQPGQESIDLRRRFDEDRDGKLADWEKKDLLDFLVARASLNVRVTSGGEALALSHVSQSVHGVDGAIDSSESVSVDLVLRAATDGRVEVSDWRPDGHVVRAVVMAQGVTLRSAGAGALDGKAGLVTGVELTKDRPLALVFSPAAE